MYQKSLFEKADENGYEIRFYDGEKPAVIGKNIHVGFIAKATEPIEEFATIILPATEYAVFDIFVAKGYGSGNAEMDRWLKDNPAQYRQLLMDGVGFVVECYNEKFKDGEPDSIVEIWIPVYKQS